MIEKDTGFQNKSRGSRDFALTLFTEVPRIVDLALEGLVVETACMYRTCTGATGRRQRRRRPLQVIHAMSMVDDHVLRDVGLDRCAIAAAGELSMEDIEGCRFERASA